MIPTVVTDHTLQNAKISRNELQTQAAAIESFAAEEESARAFSEKRAEVADRSRAKAEKAAHKEEVRAASILGASAGRAQQEAADRAQAVAVAAVVADQYAAAEAARAQAEREQNATEAALRRVTAEATAAVMNGTAAFADVAMRASEAKVKASRLDAAAASSFEAAETSKLRAQVELATANEANTTYKQLAAKAAASDQEAALLRARADAYTKRSMTALRAYRNMTDEAEQAQKFAESARAVAATQLNSGMQNALTRIEHTAAVATGALAQVKSSALRSEGGLMRRVNKTIEKLIPDTPRVELPKMAVPLDPTVSSPPCSSCA